LSLKFVTIQDYIVAYYYFIN